MLPRRAIAGWYSPTETLPPTAVKRVRRTGKIRSISPLSVLRVFVVSEISSTKVAPKNTITIPYVTKWTMLPMDFPPVVGFKLPTIPPKIDTAIMLATIGKKSKIPSYNRAKTDAKKLSPVTKSPLIKLSTLARKPPENISFTLFSRFPT